MRRGLRVSGVAEGGGSRFWFLPALCFPPCKPPAGPLRLTGGFLLSSVARDEDVVGVWGFVEVVLLALSLERARQFIKAFGERGGNLHVT